MQQYCFPYSPQQCFASYGNPLNGQRNCPNCVPFKSSLFVHVSPSIQTQKMMIIHSTNIIYVDKKYKTYIHILVHKHNVLDDMWVPSISLMSMLLYHLRHLHQNSSHYF